MPVLNYRTSLGPFSIMVGDDLYAKYAATEQNITLAQQSSLTNKWSETEYGADYRTWAGEIMSMEFLMLANINGKIDDVTYNEFKKYIPNNRFFKVTAVVGTTNVMTFALLNESTDGQERRVKIEYSQNAYGGDSDLTMYNYCKIGDGNYTNAISEFPYGRATGIQLGSPLYGCFNVRTMVFKEDFSSGLQISVYSSASGQTGVSKAIHYYKQEISPSYWSSFFGAVNSFSTDPLVPGGASTPGGGDGTFDFSSTPINYPGLPTIGAYATGFVNIYVPSAADLRTLSAYMWAGAFDIDNFRKLVADPMDAIMGLSILPVTASEIGVTSSTMVVGNISTGITMNRANSQYVSVDCGEVEVLPKWGAYLDFAPYSKLQLFLPYIGFVDISLDDVMNGSIGVRYSIDILSGSCVAFVMCKDHVIYTFGGSCACQCPVTEGQYRNGLFGVLDLISGIGQVVSAGQASAPSSPTRANPNPSMSANVAGAIPAAVNAVEGMAGTVISMVKPNINRSGAVGGSAGLMSYQIPYLVLTIPHMCIPGEQNKYMGYPSFVTMQMSELSGYTEINVTHLHNMTCTDTEVAEILALLDTGVIF